MISGQVISLATEYNKSTICYNILLSPFASRLHPDRISIGRQNKDALFLSRECRFLTAKEPKENREPKVKEKKSSLQKSRPEKSRSQKSCTLPASAVAQFLKEHLDCQRPLLLALSGGCDSVALFHLVLSYYRKNPFLLHVVHIHHGWRIESDAEALAVEEWVKQAQLPFHLVRLKSQPSCNIEDAFRQMRLKAFKEILMKIEGQAVLLAHHRDDQVETVLKRVLEGASLPFLSGLRPVSDVEGVALWRPLLALMKQDLLKWNEQNGHSFFSDASNLDSRFLRARMRSSLLPEIERQFGKNIAPSLHRVASEAALLHDYLTKKSERFWQKTYFSPLGAYIDLSKEAIEPTEFNFYFHRLLERFKLCYKSHLALSVRLGLEQNKKDQHFPLGKSEVIVDRRHLFIVNPLYNLLVDIDDKLPLKMGQSSYGPWTLELEEVEAVDGIKEDVKGKASLVDGEWKKVWCGQGELFLPKGSYIVQFPSFCLESDCALGYSCFKKKWQEAKVPAFLRSIVPSIWQEGKIVAEFLSGRFRRPQLQKAASIRIRLQWSQDCGAKEDKAFLPSLTFL